MEEMRVRLEKLSSEHDRLSKSLYEGVTQTLPSPGLCFWMGVPHDDPKKDAKVLRTSWVKSVVAKAIYQMTKRESVTMFPRAEGGWVQVIGKSPPRIVAELTDLEMVKEGYYPVYEFETKHSKYRLTVLGPPV